LHTLFLHYRPANLDQRIDPGPNPAATTATAGGVSTTQSAVRISWIRSDVAGRTVTCGRFEADRASIASGAAVTSSVLPATGSLRSSATITFVRGASSTGGATTTICPAAALAESADRTARCRTFCGVPWR